MDIGKDLNDLLKNAIDLQKKQRLRTVLVVTLIALTGAILFFYSNFFTAKTIKEEIQKDSTTSNPVYKKIVKKQNEDITLVMEKYFDARISKDLNLISTFYADTIFNYFYSFPNQFQTKMPVLTKKEILKIENIDFKKKDNRIFEYVEFLSFSEISNKNNNRENDLIVFVKGKLFNKDKIYDSILEIKVRGKDQKIYSIRPYIDTFRKTN